MKNIKHDKIKDAVTKLVKAKPLSRSSNPKFKMSKNKNSMKKIHY